MRIGLTSPATTSSWRRECPPARRRYAFRNAPASSRQVLNKRKAGLARQRDHGFVGAQGVAEQAFGAERGRAAFRFSTARCRCRGPASGRRPTDRIRSCGVGMEARSGLRRRWSRAVDHHGRHHAETFALADMEEIVEQACGSSLIAPRSGCNGSGSRASGNRPAAPRRRAARRNARVPTRRAVRSVSEYCFRSSETKTGHDTRSQSDSKKSTACAPTVRRRRLAASQARQNGFVGLVAHRSRTSRCREDRGRTIGPAPRGSGTLAPDVERLGEWWEQARAHDHLSSNSGSRVDISTS